MGLALDLLNCHLSRAGRTPTPCHGSGRAASQCVGTVSENTFALYTLFFNEARAICAYVQARDYKDETLALLQGVGRLAADAGQAVEQVFDHVHALKIETEAAHATAIHQVSITSPSP